MLIVSWNVAGLGTTVQRIDKNYGGQVAAGVRRKQPSSVLKAYIERHQADILCLQEAKIPLSQLRHRSEPLQCAHVEGYESFWSCCVATEKKGFNGVVTYCKKGTVVSANSRPFGCPDLDEQGRCVMTDHGSFVVFNVYAPAGGGNPMSYKMRFLNGLRRAMQKQRDEHGKRVILVGDLNVSHTSHDNFWASRCLDVNRICRQVQDAANASQDSSGADIQLPRWKSDLARVWPKIVSTLTTRKTVEVTTTNPRTGETFQKYRLAVTLPTDDNDNTTTSSNKTEPRQIFLGKHEEHPDYCYYYFDFDECSYTDADTDEHILVSEENVIAISTVAELIGKIGFIEWDEQTQRQIAVTDGIANPLSPPRRWLNDGIMEQDGMIDAFRHFYPTAEGRFTVWDQFRNKRYTNEGTRIDFTLIDASLKPYLLKGDVRLRCGCSNDRDAHDPNSEEAALCAATCGGKYVAVSFVGGGIVEASQTTLDRQFGPPHTGMIYTPPSFSDHIAVSVLLDDAIDEQCASCKLGLQANDTAVREAQPHKRQQTIKDIFSASSSNCVAYKSDGDASSLKKTNVKRKGLMDKFISTNSGSSAASNFCDDSNRDQGVPAKMAKTLPVNSLKGKTSNGKRPGKGSKDSPSVLSFFGKKST
jgi:exodeoxyribonuclease III